MEFIIAKTAHRIPELLARAAAGDVGAAVLLGIIGTSVVAQAIKDHQ